MRTSAGGYPLCRVVAQLVDRRYEAVRRVVPLVACSDDRT
jgi:hypothetical protein